VGLALKRYGGRIDE
jgi:hypothetical protein